MEALKAEKRSITTQGELNQLRKKGFIPGIIYGGGKPNIPIYLSQRDFLSLLHKGKNPLFSLTIEGKKENVIIKEKQVNPRTNEIIHLDLMRVGLKEKIEVEVEIKCMGIPQGVKEGGLLEQHIHKVNIKCLPTSIPTSIEVNVESLKIGDMLYIKDIITPSEIEILEEKDKLVFSLIPPKAEEVVKEKIEITEPEVIKKGKKEEEIE